MKTSIKRNALLLLICLVFAGTVTTGCDFRKYYYGHKADCRDDDCDGCDSGKGYPRDWGDDDKKDTGSKSDSGSSNDSGSSGDNGNTGDTPTDRYKCLQQCYDKGHDKATCQRTCDTQTPPATDGGTSTPDTGTTPTPDTGSGSEIDKDAYDACWTSCKKGGEVDCVCESKCRSLARGVWVSKCWESCAKEGQDLAVCKKKCDA